MHGCSQLAAQRPPQRAYPYQITLMHTLICLLASVAALGGTMFAEHIQESSSMLQACKLAKLAQSCKLARNCCGSA